MARNLFLVFNHEITPFQEEDAKRLLDAEAVVDLPPELKRIWSGIPPHLEKIRGYIQPLMDWLTKHSEKGDFVLIQGDFGACYIMVNFALEKGLVPIYSTTKREAVEERLPDGSISLKHVFRHRIFRRYED